MRRGLTIFAVISLFVFGLAPKAHACSCFDLSEEEGIAFLDVAFVGTPISVERVSPHSLGDFYAPNRVEFQVEKAILGSVSQTTFVFTGDGGGDCGVNVVMDQQRFVVAYELEGSLVMDSCSARLTEAGVVGEAEKLIAAGELEEPVLVPGEGDPGPRLLMSEIAVVDESGPEYEEGSMFMVIWGLIAFTALSSAAILFALSQWWRRWRGRRTT